VDTYTQAIEAVIADPEFQKESGQFIGTYPQLTGEAARESLKAATTMSPEAREWLVNWLKSEYDAEL
jgi:hypothetical protein